MVKIIDVGMESSYILQHTRYACKVSGNVYEFDRGVGTEVNNKEDIEFFKKGGFYIVGLKKAVVAKIKGEDAVKKVVEEVKPKQKTEKEIYALNKAAQAILIRKLGGSNHRIPTFEKERVALILKLQGKVEVGG